MKESNNRLIYGLIYLIIMVLGILINTLTFHILFGLILILCLYEMYKLRKGKSKIISFLFIIIPLIIIHDLQKEVVLGIFIITCIFDSFAYIVGVKFGKHKMMPLISPKKSWEGFIGGYLSTIIITYFTIRFLEFNLALNWSEILIIPIGATIGDFTASYYKRKAKVKDSGKIIPGHGGIIDRMDAFMITIPVIYITNIFL